MIRPARDADLEGILALAEARRAQYATHQPIFWRPAADAVDRQRPFLAGMITDDGVIFRVAVTGGALAGFVVAQLVPAPPVYDPGGQTCVIDDFAVSDPDLWATVGVDLLRDVQVEAAHRGAAQMVVVCGRQDQAKRAALDACGLAIASEWWVTTFPVGQPAGDGARSS